MTIRPMFPSKPSRLRYQNIPERVAQLRAHIKSRRGRRDFKALQRLAELVNYHKGILNAPKLNDLLKQVYTDELLASCEYRNPFLNIIARDDCPTNRAYFVQPVVYNMVKARCPDCDELIEIHPNGKDPATTFRRQRLILHPDKRTPGKLCDGSGKDV